ncbi:MAG: hypothetical protein ACO3FA_09085 [Vulcanococcus sp.]
MTPTTRSGRPRAGRASDALRSSARVTPARPTAHRSATPAASSTATTASPRPAHRESPSWEELFGRR